MPYLNLTTNEYPRYAGDVALAPNDEWVEVAELPIPAVGEFEVLEYAEPTLEADGSWTQGWIVRPMTKAEKDIALAPRTAKAKLLALGLTEVEIQAIANGLR